MVIAGGLIEVAPGIFSQAKKQEKYPLCDLKPEGA